jgi:hypothetical protein
MSRRSREGECRLCLRTQKLTRSHILPEFLYSDTYDDEHRFISATNIEALGARPRQVGFREHLLCGDCEAFFNRWEDPLAKLLRAAREVPCPANVQHFFIAADPGIVQLFALSVLWRCSEAAGVMFARTQLGPHADRIRHILLAADADAAWRYPVILQRIDGAGETPRRMIEPPWPMKYMGHRTYFMQAFGYHWLYIVSGHALAENRAMVERLGHVRDRVRVNLMRYTGEVAYQRYMARLLRAQGII